MRLSFDSGARHAAVNRRERKRSFVAGVYDWAGAAVFSLTAVVLFLLFVVRIVGVDGTSMVPTLNDGDRLLVSVLPQELRRGDIVIVNRYTLEPLIKRIVAVEGDTVRIDSDQGRVFLNGDPLYEPYIQGKTLARDFGDQPRTVPDGYLVVMGDNREYSKDSRSAEIGLVPVEDVIGRAFFRFAPSKDFGPI